MPAKLKTELGEFHFWWKLALQAIFSVMAVHVHRHFFLKDWPGASIGEYIVYSLTECNYFLVLFPFLCLVWISGKSNETYRYPLMLRYRSRNEFFCIRFMARGIFLAAMLMVHIGILIVAGHSLPIASQMVFVSSENLTGIIIRQFLNIFCYVCVMLLMHEILLNIIGNAMLDIMLTVALSLLNLLVVKLVMKSVVMWTPWGNIAYRLFGQEKSNYQFYGLYWIFLIVLLFYLADELTGRKDYVFEETHKVN